MTSKRQNPDGTFETVLERFRIAGDTLIVNRDNEYLINAKFRVQGDTLTISALEFRAELVRL